MELQDYIKDVKDFPSEGIVFKDITPLLGSPKAFKYCAEKLIENITMPVDKVVGIEARGFFFGGLLAEKLNAGFVPVRKKGKLPRITLEESYALEYGDDVLQIHADAIQKGDNVLLHDDVLATGGTAKAVCNLIERLGGNVVQCNFIITLDFLKGKEKIAAPIHSVINY